MGGGRETPKAFPLRGSLFAVPAGFMVLPRALPLGELDAKRPERARPLTETPPWAKQQEAKTGAKQKIRPAFSA